MNKEEMRDMQRLIDEADTAHNYNMAYFVAGCLVGAFVMIARGILA